MQTNMTEHFKLNEFIKSDVAAKNGIDNTPSKEVIDNISELAVLLEKIRRKWNSPLIITSGYRCEKLNKLIGGAKNSQHLKGQAADIISKDNKELFKLIMQMVYNGEITIGQLIDEKNYRWLHISTPHLKTDNQILHLK